jgi:putative SOS response-associated peptidase YedK
VEGAEQWLSGEAGKEILGPFPAEEMAARVISKRINKPENPSVLEEGEIEQGERLI